MSTSCAVTQYIVVARAILRPLLCPLSTSLTTSLASLRSILTLLLLLLLLLLSDSSDSKLGEARLGLVKSLRAEISQTFLDEEQFGYLHCTGRKHFQMYKRLYIIIINVEKGECRYVTKILAIKGKIVSSFREKSHEHPMTMTKYNMN